MKVYALVLFIFIFSGVSSIMDDMGIWGEGDHVHQSNIYDETDSTGEAYEIEQSLNDPDEIKSPEQQEDVSLLVIGKLVWGIFGSILHISTDLIKYGVPVSLAGLIQGIVWIVYIIGGFQMWTGRGMKNYE